MKIRSTFILFIIYSTLLSNEIINIDLITTNDLHGVIPEQKAYFMNPQFPPTIIGSAGFYNYINENIDSENSLIFDAGNFFQGHPISEIDSGRTIIEYMNKIGYTAAVPGADDFVYGATNLNELVDNSNFPFLISNLECNNCELTSKNFSPYIIKEINGIKFGVLGIIDSELSLKVLPQNMMNININGIKESLEYWVPKIKEQSDVIIVLTSTGVPWDREEVYNNFILDIKNQKADNNFKNLNAIQMGYFSDNVDLIVSGGFSKGYRIPWEDPNSGVHIIQNYGNGTSFGHLSLNIMDNKYKGYEFMVKNNLSQTLLLDDFPPDYELRDWIIQKEDIALDKLYQLFEFDTKIISTEDTQIFDSNNNEDNWPFPLLGSNEKFDIITWNCEFFPIADENTISALSEAIQDFNVDVIAFQEIKQVGWFGKLMELLPNYDYVISKHSSFMSQAIIFKSNQFSLIRQVEPFAENDYNFAGRPPLRADLFRYSDSTYYSIVNLHMKCCDSGLNRRKNASKMLYDYLLDDINNGYSNFIVLGDWNDDLKDNYGEHCFDPFINDDRFYFTTEKIVDDLSQASYPKEPYYSFLDHILITKEILIQNSNFEIKTIRMGKYMDSYENYEKLISDHLPVLLSF